MDVGSGGNSGLTDGRVDHVRGAICSIFRSLSERFGRGSGILLTGSAGNIIYNNTVYGPAMTNRGDQQASALPRARW